MIINHIDHQKVRDASQKLPLVAQKGATQVETLVTYGDNSSTH